MTDNKELVERVAEAIKLRITECFGVAVPKELAKAAIDVMQNHFPDVGKMVEQQTLMAEMAEALEAAIPYVIDGQLADAGAALHASNMNLDSKVAHSKNAQNGKQLIAGVKQTLAEYNKMMEAE